MDMQTYNPPTSGRAGLLRLDFNENTVGCSPAVLKAMRKMDKSTFSVYPEYASLRQDIAAYCGVRPQEVIPTDGTDEAIKLITEAYIEKGKDEIVIPTPTYAMFKFYAQLNEAGIREVLYNEDLSFPTKKVLEAITTKTKLVILVNPNNPTGTSIAKGDIIRILDKAKRSGAVVLIDEAYWQFYGRTAIPLVKKYDNLFVTQTFSKALGLAGLRLGYIISNERNIALLQKALSPYSVNIIAAFCARAALRDEAYVKNYVGEVRKSKSMLYRELDELGIFYYRSDANFVLLKVGRNSGAFCRKMREREILVRDRSSDALLDGYVRVTLGTINQTKRFIRELRRVMKEIGPLLIFDIDGVLADVSRSYRVSIKKTAEYFTGRNISFDDIQAYKNRGGLNNDWDLTEAIIRDKGVAVDKKGIIRKFQEYYNKPKSNEVWLLDKNILEALSQRGTLAILTGRPKKEASYILRKNNVTKYFKVIVAMEDISRQKPNPQGLLRIMRRCPCPDACYFGDTIDDMKAARAANIIPIGVLPPQDRSSALRNLLIRNGASAVLNNINQIARVLP